MNTKTTIAHRWLLMLFAGALCIGGGLAAHAAALYQWTDAEGNVVFSDQPPPEPPAGGYEGPKPPTIGEWLEQVAEEERKAREVAAARARAGAAEQAAAKAEADAAAEARAPKKRIESRYTCEQARNLLAGLRDPGREFYATGADGNFRKRTPEELKERIAEWEQAEAILCEEGVEVVPPGTPPAWPPPENTAAGESAAQTPSAAPVGGAQAPPPVQ